MSENERDVTSEQKPPAGETLVVEITKDEREVRVRLMAPEPGGDRIEFEAAKEKILQAGVTHGFNEQALRGALYDRKYGEPYIVAEATPAQDGGDAKLIFHFSTDERTGRPREIGGGRVDYKSLDLFVPVSEGQLLVTKTPATAGNPGTTVKGKPIKERPGRDIALPKGKNIVINAEKTEVHAKTSGFVELVKGSVNVSNVYSIEGDCGPNVGNIDFDGSVKISGNVLSGHVLKATGSVVIEGVVGASEIIAGGNVEIKLGMQGVSKGRIEAGGSVSLMYIERGTVIADGSITVDASIHSILEAGDSIYAKGTRGNIIGGRAGAAKEIVVNSIGSDSYAQTEVEVGVMPQKRARLTHLEKERERLTGELHKINQLDAYLEKSKEKLETDTYAKLHRSGVENRRAYNELLEEHEAEISELKYEMEHATEGKVHVFDTVHPGARIIIASDVYKVNDVIQYTTFKYRDGMVVSGACEIKKG